MDAVERRADEGVDVVEQSDHADLRGRGDGPGRRLVVERHVAAGHREPQRAARVADPAHGLRQLPERRRSGRVAVVEAVRHAQRPGAGDRHVAGRLGDRPRRAEPGIDRADRLVAIRRRDQGLARAPHAQDGGAATRAGDRVRADRRVVLLEDGVTRGEVGRPEERHEDRARIHPALGKPVADRRRRTRRRGAAAVGRGGGDALVDDRVAGQRAGRDPGQDPGAPRQAAVRLEATGHDRDVAVGGDPADDRHRKAPALAHVTDRIPFVGQDGGTHPLLRLGDHHLERLETRFAARDGVEVDRDPGPGPVGRLGRGAGDAAGAEVLEALDQVALDELEARLDEQLLGERVADLDRRALGLHLRLRITHRGPRRRSASHRPRSRRP